MKKYRIDRAILEAGGAQTYEVEAVSVKEAEEKFRNGKGEFVHEEIDITNLSDINENEIYEAD